MKLEDMRFPTPPGAEVVVRAEPSRRRVRVRFGRTIIADSTRALLISETGRVPVYYFPRADVQTHLLVPGTDAVESRNGPASYFAVQADGLVAQKAGWQPVGTAGALDLSDHVAFYWDEMHGWYEEDEEVFVHARDPYVRVDALQSSRQVRAVFAGEVIAESRRPVVVLETGLPIRYYLPRIDVRMDLLEPSSTRTRCPYKGTATYWALRVGDAFARDAVWAYETPECPKLAGTVSFYPEMLDELLVDGSRI